ncbi:UNVERIFIED_CONTAM: hypothetical protein HDU68_003846 [Siphonaria sp. JEL0065]|nr:hypothetical protein HDU68_003846 [Siphonaria sp. JEL0065]
MNPFPTFYAIGGDQAQSVSRPTQRYPTSPEANSPHKRHLIHPLLEPDNPTQRHPVYYFNAPELSQNEYSNKLFISTPSEAQLLLEAAIGGKFPILNAGPTMSTTTYILSGTAIVFAENNRYSQMIRFRDGYKYRVINYFYPNDVDHFYEKGKEGRLLAPSQCLDFLPITRGYGNQQLEQDARQSPAEETDQSVKTMEVMVPSLSLPFRLQPVSKSPKTRPKPYQREPSTPPISLSTTACIPIVRETFSMTRKDSIMFDYEKHVVFQVQESVQCPCGGLGLRRAVDYFRGQEDWTCRPVVLAPLIKKVF